MYKYIYKAGFRKRKLISPFFCHCVAIATQFGKVILNCDSFYFQFLCIFALYT